MCQVFAKLVAYGLARYMKDPWNVFDLLLVIGTAVLNVLGGKLLVVERLFRKGHTHHSVCACVRACVAVLNVLGNKGGSSSQCLLVLQKRKCCIYEEGLLASRGLALG